MMPDYQRVDEHQLRRNCYSPELDLEELLNVAFQRMYFLQIAFWWSIYVLCSNVLLLTISF